jgi:FMN phosphatase YigB (HAD superfamily)
MIKCIAFDCFGTVFDMRNISRQEIQDYVDHVNKKDFSPYSFPNSWYALTAHEDSAAGIKLLQDNGYYCLALSNGSYDLIKTISESNNIYWNYIINLNKHKVYKPHFDAYKTIETDTNFKPTETLMVTANPKFGDIEGAKNINMYSAVIRHGYLNTIPELVDYIQNLENFITFVNQPEKNDT